LLLAATLAMPARAGCGEEDWQGLQAGQEELSRHVTIEEDGSSSSVIRGAWRMHSAPPAGGAVGFHLCPNTALGHLELIKLKVDEADLLDGPVAGRSAGLTGTADGESRLRVSGLRSGDRLEVEWRLTQRPLIPGHAFTTLVLDKSHLPLKTNFRVEAPPGITLHHRSSGLATPPTRSHSAGGEVLDWTGTPESLLAEGKATPRITVGTAADWETVRAWFRQHYRAAYLRDWPGRENLGRLLEYKDDHSPDLTPLLAWLKSRVATVRAEQGMDALLPRTPDTVLARGEADCKDLAVLLASVLVQAGVAAWPVLWSPSDLRDELPNPHVFVHALLAVETAAGRYLLDPISGRLYLPAQWAGHLLELDQAVDLIMGGAS
jgi:hypothetical protein